MSQRKMVYTWPLESYIYCVAIWWENNKRVRKWKHSECRKMVFFFSCLWRTVLFGVLLCDMCSCQQMSVIRNYCKMQQEKKPLRANSDHYFMPFVICIYEIIIIQQSTMFLKTILTMLSSAVIKFVLVNILITLKLKNIPDMAN